MSTRRRAADPSVEIASHIFELLVRSDNAASKTLAEADRRLRAAGLEPGRLGAGPGGVAVSDDLAAINEAAAVDLAVLDTALIRWKVEAAAKATRRQEEAARLEAERRMRPIVELVPGINLEFVHVPAGEFPMGSTKGLSSERPVHVIWLEEFFIGRYQVTVEQFAAFVKATGTRCDPNAIKDAALRARQPVAHVNWSEAVAFCNWASKITGMSVGLPTEAQWEKAARGTDGREYPWGNQEPDDGLCRLKKILAIRVRGTMPVGSYSPRGDSPYGAADMAGNVWEWCADWHDADYYAKSPARNPKGPDSGKYRVMRGGSCGDYISHVRSAHRGGIIPGHRASRVGFRLARLP